MNGAGLKVVSARVVQDARSGRRGRSGPLSPPTRPRRRRRTGDGNPGNPGEAACPVRRPKADATQSPKKLCVGAALAIAGDASPLAGAKNAPRDGHDSIAARRGARHVFVDHLFCRAFSEQVLEDFARLRQAEVTRAKNLHLGDEIAQIGDHQVLIGEGGRPTVGEDVLGAAGIYLADQAPLRLLRFETRQQATPLMLDLLGQGPGPVGVVRDQFGEQDRGRAAQPGAIPASEQGRCAIALSIGER